MRMLSERLGLARDRRRATRTPTSSRFCNLGEIADVSSTGARVICRRFYRPTPGKRVSLRIPGGVQGPALRVSGVICWVSDASGAWQAGIALDRPDSLVRFTHSQGRAETRRKHLKARQDEMFRPGWTTGGAENAV